MKNVSKSKSLLVTSLLVGSMSCANAYAEKIELEHNGMTLNANLELAEDKTLADGVLMLTHGTLAHNEMEIISTLQDLMVDYGVSTLSINLSYGIDNRASAMYDCSVPAQHTMQQASAEMQAWQSWLDSQGAGDRWIMGHSRGGNQTAQFAAQNADKIKGQILLAPATWNYETTLEGYAKRYAQPVEPLLEQAKSLEPKAIMDGVSIVYCENSGASAEAMLSYYGNYPEYDTPTVLSNTTIPSLVIAGSLDTVVPDLPEKMESINRDNIEFVIIEDADHFFLDLFADEVADYAIDFIENL